MELHLIPASKLDLLASFEIQHEPFVQIQDIIKARESLHQVEASSFHCLSTQVQTAFSGTIKSLPTS